MHQEASAQNLATDPFRDVPRDRFLLIRIDTMNVAYTISHYALSVLWIILYFISVAIMTYFMFAEREGIQ
jgi:hypothetical protein